jgi:hypothetical protein
MFRVTRLKGEGSVADLVERLFKFEGDDAKKSAKAAERALVEANPQLRDLKNLPVGTFIIVPEVESAAFARGSKPFAAEELAEHLHQAVKGIRIAFDAQTARQADSANETLDLARSKELKSLARKDADVKKRVAEISKEAKASLKQAKETEKAREKIFKQMTQHIEGILKSLG